MWTVPRRHTGSLGCAMTTPCSGPGLLDLNYKVDGLNKFSVKNSYNQAAEDRVSEFDGMNYAGSDAERTAVQWNERSLYLVQV